MSICTKCGRENGKNVWTQHYCGNRKTLKERQKLTRAKIELEKLMTKPLRSA